MRQSDAGSGQSVRELIGCDERSGRDANETHTPPLSALSPTSLSNSLPSLMLGGLGRAGWRGQMTVSPGTEGTLFSVSLSSKIFSRCFL